MKKYHLTIIAALLPLLASAQGAWTLEQCIDYALQHSITLKQKENSRRQQELSVSTARNSRLPDLNFQGSENFNFGRSLTSENIYTNTNTSSTAFSLSTSVPLLTGNRIPNTLKQSRLNLEAATADLEKARDDIKVQIAQQYIQTVYDMEILATAQRQIAIDSMQVYRLEERVKVGKSSVSELAQQKATLAQSRLTATESDNSLKLALVTLSQLLELPTAEGFAILPPALTTATQ